MKEFFKKNGLTIAGIKSEAKKVSWLKKKDLVKNTMVVIAFCAAMSLFFYGSDLVIATILKLLGMN